MCSPARAGWKGDANWAIANPHWAARHAIPAMERVLSFAGLVTFPLKEKLQMPIPAATALALAFVLAILLATDLWVYADAKENAARGNPVVFSTSWFEVSRPVVWLLGCLVIWEVFFPLYVNSRPD